MEVWKDIKGYYGLYQVSNTGKVRSMFFRNNKVIKERIKELKTVTNKKKRVYVSIQYEGKRKNLTVHRLVADAFIPNPAGLPEVNHIDGDPTNNNVCNLEWCTKSQNAKHAYKNNLAKLREYNEKNKKRVVRDDGVVFDSIRGFAREIGVSQRALNDVLQKKQGRKTVKGHSYKYFNEGDI